MNLSANSSMSQPKIETLIHATRKPLPQTQDLSFGKHFADHMFVAHYSADKGWYKAQVLPYAPLSLDPAACVLHYGQALFEGLKAFRQKDGRVAVFRPEFNWKRMVDGAERLCMQAPPKELWMNALVESLKVNDSFVPSEPGTSLYIRPTLIASEGFLGVRPSNEYLFFIIFSPAASYYGVGSAPVKIWVEKEFVRAAPGGLGATKAAANYAGSLKAALQAKKKNYSQVLWLDVSKKYVEEVGTMNVFFVMNDEVLTPSLDGTILEGNTRAACIELLRSQGYKVSERKITLAELTEAYHAGKLTEAFGTGTAAMISPIGELASSDHSMIFKEGPVAQLLKKEITAIQYGEKPDAFGWMYKI